MLLDEFECPEAHKPAFLPFKTTEEMETFNRSNENTQRDVVRINKIILIRLLNVILKNDAQNILVSDKILQMAWWSYLGRCCEMEF